MTGSEIYLKIKSFFQDKASTKIKKFLGKVATMGSKTGKFLSGLNGAFGAFGDTAGKAANNAGRLVSGLAELGPVGAIIAGVNIAVETIGKRFMTLEVSIHARRATGDRYQIS